MTVVFQLDLPQVDFDDPTLRGDRFHDVLRDLRERHWLARTEVGVLVLDRTVAVEVLRDRRLAFPALQLLQLQGITRGSVWDRTVNGLMVQKGEPHIRLRRLAAPAFTPRAIARLREALRRFLADLWDAEAGDGRCEFVASFAQPIPSRVIAEMLGVPDQAERLARWSILLQAVFKFNLDEDWAEVERTYEDVRDWVLALVEERRARPGEDFISAMATLDVGGDRLTDDECVTMVAAVISGGTDTTQAQLAHGMRLFAQHPEQWELLAERQELAAQAATEVLRYEPITPVTARVALEDVEYRDVRFPQGTLLFACAAAANRDPTVFERPDRFDITVDRHGAPILTFGFGDHFCLGAQLARVELAETFGFLSTRMRNLALDGEPRFGSLKGIYAMESLPIRFDPAA